MCGDRVGDGDIGLTHEALAIMLGIRRGGVTVAVNNLEKTGAIAAARTSRSPTARACSIYARAATACRKANMSG